MRLSVQNFGKFTKILLLVCSLSLASFFSSRAQDRLGDTSISVLFWNVYLLPDLLFADSAKQKRADLIPGAIISEGADVVVLSEMFHDELSASVLSALSKDYPFQTNILADNSSFWDRNFPTFEGGGVVVLSKYEIDHSDELIYSDASGLDQLSNKGVVYARIIKEGQPFHIFASHLQAYADSQAVRESQLKEYASFVSGQKLAQSDPVLHAGDFNIDLHDKKNFGNLLKIMKVQTPELSFEEQRPFSYDPVSNGLAAKGKPEWLDYILISDQHAKPSSAKISIRKMKANKKLSKAVSVDDLSDHFAILGTFEF